MPLYKKKRKVAGKVIAMTLEKKDWLVGDLVIAKLRGHRAWPAQIETSEDYGYNPRAHKIFVKFFGSQEVGFCSYKDVTPFTSAVAESLMEQPQKMKTDLEFRGAIEQIMVSYNETNGSTKAHGIIQREHAPEDADTLWELPRFLTKHPRSRKLSSLVNADPLWELPTSITEHPRRRKRSSPEDADPLWELPTFHTKHPRCRKQTSEDSRDMKMFAETHGSNHKGELSEFFTGCLGSVTESSAENGSGKPLPQLSGCGNYFGDYCHEEKEKEHWYKYICENLDKHVVRKKVAVTVETLMKQTSRTVPIRELEIVSESQIVQDAKGRSLLFFLKDALQVPIPHDPKIQGLNALQAFVEVHKPPRPPKNDQRYVSSIIPKGYGVHHLCFWPGLGHRAEEGVLSRHIIGVAGYKNNAVKKFLNEFTPITQAVGALFEAVDHRNYQRYNEHFHKVAADTSASFLRTTKRNCFLGMAVITGLSAGPHRDEKDSDDGWVADICFGDFEGGYLQVPQLGREFVLRPGDIVFMRSRLLQHSVSKITSGLRFGVVYFTHKSMMPKSTPE